MGFFEPWPVYNPRRVLYILDAVGVFLSKQMPPSRNQRDQTSRRREVHASLDELQVLGGRLAVLPRL